MHPMPLLLRQSTMPRIVVQVEDSIEHDQHIPVAQYEENLSIVDAYNDPQFQPVVVMKRLDDAR